MEAIVGYPFRIFIETILARLIGKFINPDCPIDLKKAKFNSNVIQLTDLDLNVQVLNQIDGIKDSPLVIVKCVVGQFKLNIEDIFKKKVSVAISDVSKVHTILTLFKGRNRSGTSPETQNSGRSGTQKCQPTLNKIEQTLGWVVGKCRSLLL